ncbi:MAG: metal-dependent transcriptional regulator [Anaerolineae bacterium]
MSSISVEDYLLAIYRLQADESPVSTSTLAGHLGVAPPSVTGMLHKLRRAGLVNHEPYYGVVLTARGQRQALCLLRRHRLWELFLTDVLGLSWDEVHAEAHRLEHATSDRVAEKLAAFLGEPDIDPHGQPIPARDGTLLSRSSLRLTEIETGQTVQIVEVPDGDPATLQYLGKLGLYPGTEVQVSPATLPEGQMELWLGGVGHRLERQMANRIAVKVARK